MILFTEEMKKTHTILLPNMLPIHFKLLGNLFRQEGYKIDFFNNRTLQEVQHEGLKSVHNDMCYPATLVIGELIMALKSGDYDLDYTALLITQTGGGCRASNYIHLLRKALEDNGLGHVPVISFNTTGIEKHPGFRLSPNLARSILNAFYYGDLLMWLYNQCKPYELEANASDRCLETCIETLNTHTKGFNHINYYYSFILEAFSAIPRHNKKKIKVGIVGEIYLKYSPLGNNHLEQFLMNEGVEVVVSGVSDFILYCCYNPLMDYKFYGMGKKKLLLNQIIYRYLRYKQNVMIRYVKKYPHFTPPTPFEHLADLAKNFVSLGVKMGEGWLLTGEIVEYITSGVNNVVCAQPFGCLPNHVVGKGMIRKIINQYPTANVAVIDYDPSATQVNIENRLKLMLANANTKVGSPIRRA